MPSSMAKNDVLDWDVSEKGPTTGDISQSSNTWQTGHNFSENSDKKGGRRRTFGRDVPGGRPRGPERTLDRCRSAARLRHGSCSK
jgi:hypothetical protein